MHEKLAVYFPQWVINFSFKLYSPDNARRWIRASTHKVHSWFHSRVKYFCLRRGSSYFRKLVVCQGKTARERAFRKLIQLDGNENVRRREWPRCGCRPAILHARTCVSYATGMQTLRNNYYNAVDRDCAEKSPVHARARVRVYVHSNCTCFNGVYALGVAPVYPAR